MLQETRGCVYVWDIFTYVYMPELIIDIVTLVCER